LAETTVFLSYFKDMPAHRQAGKVTYPLDEILLLRPLAVLARAEAFTDIARFGEKKLDLLRRFRPYRDGTPAHDHLGDIFATLDAQAFQRCFVEGAIVYVLAADDTGQYEIPFPVVFRDDSWWNARTGQELDTFIAGWRPADDVE